MSKLIKRIAVLVLLALFMTEHTQAAPLNAARGGGRGGGGGGRSFGGGGGSRGGGRSFSGGGSRRSSSASSRSHTASSRTSSPQVRSARTKSTSAPHSRATSSTRASSHKTSAHAASRAKSTTHAASRAGSRAGGSRLSSHNAARAGGAGLAVSRSGRVVGVGLVGRGGIGAFRNHTAGFWGGYRSFGIGGFGCCFYPGFGLWWAPFCGGLWWYPGCGAWFWPGSYWWWYPTWGCSLLYSTVYADYDGPPYVVIDRRRGGLYFAVYERQDAGQETVYVQVEEPRKVKRKIKIYLDHRGANDVIIMSRNPRELALKLSEDDAAKLKVVELSDKKGKGSTSSTDRKSLRMEETVSERDEAELAKNYEQIEQNKDKLNSFAKGMKNQDTSTETSEQ